MLHLDQNAKNVSYRDDNLKDADRTEISKKTKPSGHYRIKINLSFSPDSKKLKPAASKKLCDRNSDALNESVGNSTSFDKTKKPLDTNSEAVELETILNGFWDELSSREREPKSKNISCGNVLACSTPRQAESVPAKTYSFKIRNNNNNMSSIQTQTYDKKKKKLFALKASEEVLNCNQSDNNLEIHSNQRHSDSDKATKMSKHKFNACTDYELTQSEVLLETGNIKLEKDCNPQSLTKELQEPEVDKENFDGSIIDKDNFDDNLIKRKSKKNRKLEKNRTIVDDIQADYGSASRNNNFKTLNDMMLADLTPDEQNEMTEVKSAKRKKQKLAIVNEESEFSAGDVQELNAVQNEDGALGNSKKSKKKKKKHLEDNTNEDQLTHNENSHEPEEAKQKSKKKKKRKKANDSYEATRVDTTQDDPEVKTKSKTKKKHKDYQSSILEEIITDITDIQTEPSVPNEESSPRKKKKKRKSLEHINDDSPLQINHITTTSDDVGIKKKKKRKTEDESDSNALDATNTKTVCENGVDGPNTQELEELMATVLQQLSPKRIKKRSKQDAQMELQKAPWNDESSLSVKRELNTSLTSNDLSQNDLSSPKPKKSKKRKHKENEVVSDQQEETISPKKRKSKERINAEKPQGFLKPVEDLTNYEKDTMNVKKELNTSIEMSENDSSVSNSARKKSKTTETDLGGSVPTATDLHKRKDKKRRKSNEQQNVDSTKETDGPPKAQEMDSPKTHQYFNRDTVGFSEEKLNGQEILDITNGINGSPKAQKMHSPKNHQDFNQDSVGFSEEKSEIEIVEHSLEHLKDETSSNWSFSESIIVPRGTIKRKGRNEGKPTGETGVRQQSVLTEKLFSGTKINSKKVKNNTDIWKDDVPLEEVLCKAQEAKDLTEEQVEKLKSFEVSIPWPLHPLHTIETRISSTPTPEQWELITSLGVEIKSTMFTKDEDARIKANWVEFCKTHNWDDDPAAFLSTKYFRKIPTKERIDFARFIAHGLNNRLLRSVFGRFQKLVNHQRVTGRFSEDEDKIIVEYMRTTESNNPFADLAKILNRTNVSVIKRCKTLVESTDKTVKWTDDKIKTLLDYLLQVTKSENVDELKDKEISSKQWRKISRRMDIPEEKLRRAWLYRIKPRVFIDCTIGTDEIKISLINMLYESNEYDWRNINWDKYADNFEGISGARINKFFKDLVRYYCPEAIKNDLRACVKFLKNVVLRNVTFQSKKFKKIEL